MEKYTPLTSTPTTIVIFPSLSLHPPPVPDPKHTHTTHTSPGLNFLVGHSRLPSSERCPFSNPEPTLLLNHLSSSHYSPYEGTQAPPRLMLHPTCSLVPAYLTMPLLPLGRFMSFLLCRTSRYLSH